MLEYCPMESLHTHHNGAGHFVTPYSTGNNVRVYDSHNLDPTESLIKQITLICSPDTNAAPAITQVNMPSTQTGGVDCGCFEIAYAVDLSFNN